MSATVGRMSRWGRDAGLSARMFLVMFLLTAVYLAFIAVLMYAGVDYFALIFIAGILLAIQYFGSDKLALWSMGARVVSESESPQLHGIVDRLAQIADLPKPRIAVSDTNVPNAFATGRNPKNAVVAVTQGLLNTLTPAEIEAVLAHEMAHIRNRDVMVMTIASFFAIVAQLIMRMMFWGGMSSGRRDRRDGGAIVLIYVASILVWVISYFLIRALSRYREFAADRGAAIITGAPSQLMSALVKISGRMQRIPQRDLREVHDMNAFFIIPAAVGSGFSELFSTHPSLERRLEKLRELSREMEGL